MHAKNEKKLNKKKIVFVFRKIVILKFWQLYLYKDVHL